MPKKPHSGRRGDPVSLAPLTPEKALQAILNIKPSDAREIIAASSKPKAKRKRK